jgi:hypothetical protein
MKKYFLPATIWITVAATVLTTILRTIITPRMQEADTGEFKISLFIIGFMLVIIAVLAILTAVSKGRLYHINDFKRHDRMPMSVSALVLGFVLIISSTFDWWRWMSFGRTPPPNDVVISNLDSITLTITLIFGILAGMFFVYLGSRSIGQGLVIGPKLSIFALAPVVWIWVRIVRYEISYASAIPVEQSFYDFVMIIFTMLFLFSFSKYISKIGEERRSNQSLLFFALCTTLMSLSGPLTSVSLYMLGETEAYNASRLAGFHDLCIGVFALCTSVVLVFSHRKPDLQPEFASEPIDDEITEYAEQEVSLNISESSNISEQDTTPTVDEILEELYKYNIKPDNNDNSIDLE